MGGGEHGVCNASGGKLTLGVKLVLKYYMPKAQLLINTSPIIVLREMSLFKEKLNYTCF